MRESSPDISRRVLVGLWGAAIAAFPIAGLTLGTRTTKVFTVTLKNMAFGAAPLDLCVGDMIAWVNDDIFDHTATAVDLSFDVELKSGTRAQIILTRVGEVAFFCRYHPGMSGRLVVRPKA